MTIQYEFKILHEIEDAEPILIWVTMIVSCLQSEALSTRNVPVWQIEQRGIVDLFDAKGQSVGEKFKFLAPKILAYFDKYEIDNVIEQLLKNEE